MFTQNSKQKPRLLFFGTRGLFSRVVLQRLLAEGRKIVGVVVPSESVHYWRALTPPPPVASDLPLMPSFVHHTIVEIGWHLSIPVWEVNSTRAKEWSATLKKLAPDAIVVACWPKRIPQALLTLPKWGALNVHPSLLPHFRGPVPLFWQRRAGLRESGVTIHRMSKRLDEGDILAQAPFALPDGATGEELDALAAQQGGQLLGIVIDGLHQKSIMPYAQPAGGSYQSWPTEEAFIIPTTWSARHAWNFMQGAWTEWQTPFTIALSDGRLIVERALGFDLSATLGAPVSYSEQHVAIQFTPGVLYVASVVE